MLIVEAGSVADDTHNVMEEVPEIEEPLILHESHVPDEVRQQVAKNYCLKQGILFPALNISDEDQPVN